MKSGTAYNSPDENHSRGVDREYENALKRMKRADLLMNDMGLDLAGINLEDSPNSVNHVPAQVGISKSATTSEDFSQPSSAIFNEEPDRLYMARNPLGQGTMKLGRTTEKVTSVLKRFDFNYSIFNCFLSCVMALPIVNTDIELTLLFSKTHQWLISRGTDNISLIQFTILVGKEENFCFLKRLVLLVKYS